MSRDQISDIRDIRRPRTPGEVLLTEFLWAEQSCVAALAASTGLAFATAEAVLCDDVRIDEGLAARLADGLGTEPQFWLDLQQGVDRHDAAVATSRRILASDR